uniref:Uncharacterized protein n=1 Tax=Daucus carota subsp. sativus TaxID=79200 RepID=A0A164X466_DAUCS
MTSGATAAVGRQQQGIIRIAIFLSSTGTEPAVQITDLRPKAEPLFMTRNFENEISVY